MKRINTTRILLHNTTTGEISLLKNKRILADLFGIESRETIVNWFRESNIIKKEYNGQSYIIYKPDSYLY